MSNSLPFHRARKAYRKSRVAQYRRRVARTHSQLQRGGYFASFHNLQKMLANAIATKRRAPGNAYQELLYLRTVRVLAGSGRGEVLPPPTLGPMPRLLLTQKLQHWLARQY